MTDREKKYELSPIIINEIRKMIAEAFELHEQKESENEKKVHLDLSEKFDQAIIAARESLPMSISPMLSEMKEDIRRLREEIAPLQASHKEEQRKEIAINWFKEKAKTMKFWFGWMSGVGLFFMGMIYVLKQFLKP